MAALRVWWRTWRHVEHRGYIYIWANLFWLILSLPIITAPAAWAGLVRMSHTAHTTPSADLSDFWEGFRENLVRGALLAVANVVILLVNVSNLYAYRFETGLLTDALRAAWIAALLIWFSIQFYLWPLFYEMETPTLWGALRNAAVMVALNPLFTLGLWPGILLFAAFSSVLLPMWMLLTGSIYAALATAAVINRLEQSGYRTKFEPEA